MAKAFGFIWQKARGDLGQHEADSHKMPSGDRIQSSQQSSCYRHQISCASMQVHHNWACGLLTLLPERWAGMGGGPLDPWAPHFLPGICMQFCLYTSYREWRRLTEERLQLREAISSSAISLVNSLVRGGAVVEPCCWDHRRRWGGVLYVSLGKNFTQK